VVKCGHRGLTCDPNFYYFTVFDKVLSIHLWCLLLLLLLLLLWGYFCIYLFQKYHIFYVNFAYFCFIFLKYHSNKFLELKPKDEVTLPSPGVLFWLILECSKLQFSPFISMGAHF